MKNNRHFWASIICLAVLVIIGLFVGNQYFTLGYIIASTYIHQGSLRDRIDANCAGTALVLEGMMAILSPPAEQAPSDTSPRSDPSASQES